MLPKERKRKVARIQRHDEILKIVSLRKRVSVQELTDRLQVSEVTIRKDLSILEEMGCLGRTRGGAKPAEDRDHLNTIRARRRENVERKEAIARKDAGSFIGPQAIETLRNFQIETCFLGTTGLSSDGAFASRNTIARTDGTAGSGRRKNGERTNAGTRERAPAPPPSGTVTIDIENRE